MDLIWSFDAGWAAILWWTLLSSICSALGEQMLMVRMLGALLVHLVDLQIFGETRLPVEQVEMLILGVWGN